MLHYETVQSGTLAVLRGLMEINSLKNFYLVGGTNYSLRVGHRKSIDIDLFRFSDETVNSDLILKEISQKFDEVIFLGLKDYHLKCLINGVKIDILRYNYPLIQEPIFEENLRMIGTKDIAAMKLLAISNRGAKKDFYDFYFLLKEFSLEQIFQFYFEKFQKLDQFILCKSLCYFGNADQQIDLEIIGDITWEQAKEEIKRLAKCI